MRRNLGMPMAVLMAMTVFAAACSDVGSGERVDDAGEARGSIDAPTTVTAPATTTEAVPPTLLIWADPARAPTIREFGDRFAEEDSATVQVREIDFLSIRDRLADAAPSGEGPDIVIGAHEWLGDLVPRGLLAPFDLSGVTDRFLPAAVNAMSYEGVTYGLPYSFESVALIRNVDLVPDALATFADLEKIALELKAAGTVDVPLAVQEAPGDPYHNYPMFTAAGGVVFGLNADGSYNPDDLGIDSEGGLAAGRKFAEWTASGLIIGDLDFDTMIEVFSTGRAPFAITGPWATGAFADAGIDYSVDPFPPIDGNEASPFVGVQGFMVSAFAPNPALAETFIVDYLGTTDAQIGMFEVGGRLPAHLAAIEILADDPDLRGFAEAAINGTAVPAIPAMRAVWPAWTDAYSLILGGEEPDAALRTAAARIRDLIAQG